jgi:hypothetical protein
MADTSTPEAGKNKGDENHETFTRSVVARRRWLLEIGSRSEEVVRHSAMVSTIRELNRRSDGERNP